MRSADAVTVFRMLFAVAVAYMILARFGAVFLTAMILLLFLLDMVDGYLAMGRKENLLRYMANEAAGKRSKSGSTKKPPKYGSALDIAGDRFVEYALWLTFVYVRIVPLFVMLIILFRNVIADALVSSFGKSFRTMRTAFGRIASSHLSRGAYGAVKTMLFVYLVFVYVDAWPISVGYLLTAIVVLYSLLRGSAEVYEAVR